MGRNPIVTIVAVLLAAALAVTGAVLVFKKDTSDGAEQRINELYAEKSKLNYDIDKYRTELEGLTVTRAGVFFLFENLEENIINNAIPVLKGQGNYKGIVTVSPEEYKSSPLYTQLADLGWEFAIGFDEDFKFPENDKEAAEMLEAHIKLYSSPNAPTIISFSSGNAKYRKSFDKVIQENGIKVVIAPRLLLSGGSDFLDYDHETELLKISSVPFSVTSTVESTMRTHINSNRPLALSIKHIEKQPPLNSDRLSTEKFELMLDSLGNFKNFDAGICLPYRDFIVSEHKKNTEKYSTILEKIDKCNTKISEIEAEIETLMKNGVNS